MLALSEGAQRWDSRGQSWVPVDKFLMDSDWLLNASMLLIALVVGYFVLRSGKHEARAAIGVKVLLAAGFWSLLLLISGFFTGGQYIILGGLGMVASWITARAAATASLKRLSANPIEKPASAESEFE